MRTPPRVMPALITPFDKRGDIDLTAHRHNLAALAGHGIEGFLIAGSTGEGSTIEPGERATLLTELWATLGAKPFAMVGIWAESVRMALTQVGESADAGADAVLVVTPTTFARRTTAAQEAYFTAVADASPIPVLLYSVPPNAGYALAEDVTSRLAIHPNIVGMKDSGGDAVRIQRILTAAPEDFILFNGATASLSLAMAAGAYGAITASANYMPRPILEMVATARRSTAKSLALQGRLTAVSSVVESPGIPGVKAAASGAGLQAGLPRAPLAAVDRKTATRVLEAAGRI
ncbi:MAG: dihydrodipicolinate synthase family protein [Acidimicrobiia bacterium]